MIIKQLLLDLAALTPVLAGIYFVWRWFNPLPLDEELCNGADRARIVKEYSRKGRAAYRAYLSRLLGWTSSIWGARLWGAQAFGRALQIAYIYPLIAILIVWVGWGVGTLGGLEVLPGADPDSGQQWGWIDRLWRAMVLASLGVALWYYFSKIDVIFSFVERLFKPPKGKFDNRPGFLSKAGRLSVALLEALPVAVAFAFAGAFAGAVAGAFAFAFAGAGAVAFAFAGAVAFAVAFAVVVIVAFAGADSNTTATWLMFLVILPFLNAITDWVSLGATRFFLGRIEQGEASAVAVAIDLILDLLVALLSLLALAGLTVGALELWAWFDLPLAFDWRLFWRQVVAGESASRAILVLMLVTTLAPSFIHGFLGLSHFWTANSRAYSDAVALMKEGHGSGSEKGWCHRIRRKLEAGRFMGFMKAALVWVGLPLVLWTAWEIWQLFEAMG